MNWAKWVKMEHPSGSLDSAAGEVRLSLCDPGESGSTGVLIVAKIDDVHVQEQDVEHNDDWGFFDNDKETSLVWKVQRTVTLEDGEGNTVGSIKATYQGTAKAEKEVEEREEREEGSRRDGDTETKYTKKVRTKSVEYDMQIDGKPVSIEHGLLNRGDKWWQSDSDIAWAQTYTAKGIHPVSKVEGVLFSSQYQEVTMGLDQVLVTTEAGTKCLACLASGFMLAYWLHPKRVEDDAGEKAMKILQDRCGWSFGF